MAATVRAKIPRWLPVGLLSIEKAPFVLTVVDGDPCTRDEGVTLPP